MTTTAAAGRGTPRAHRNLTRRSPQGRAARAGAGRTAGGLVVGRRGTDVKFAQRLLQRSSGTHGRVHPARRGRSGLPSDSGGGRRRPWREGLCDGGCAHGIHVVAAVAGRGREWTGMPAGGSPGRLRGRRCGRVSAPARGRRAVSCFLAEPAAVVCRLGEEVRPVACGGRRPRLRPVRRKQRRGHCDQLHHRRSEEGRAALAGGRSGAAQERKNGFRAGSSARTPADIPQCPAGLAGGRAATGQLRRRFRPTGGGQARRWPRRAERTGRAGSRP